ncbi:transposase [Pararhodobacter sp. CCB-MM2]|uniref:REP-associated tyrosine transposase n=1 Tax=Pararhodobacter sp. CCB-MM2 TaxID=1786003 RepID=UPI000AC9EC3F|nr:transposase [Pararhodobacter sp. CCB-MM2]
MSQYRRLRLPGSSIFFTVSLAQRGSALLVDEIERLRLAVAQTKRERPFTIDAMVVLPDHLHCVWTLPPGDSDYATRWGAVKSRFTRLLRDACRVGFHPTVARSEGRPVGWNPTLPKTRSMLRKGDAGIWQRRFWEHHVRSTAEYHDLIAHCWMDPVRHGLARAPQDWPHSSIHRDLRNGTLSEPPKVGWNPTLQSKRAGSPPPSSTHETGLNRPSSAPR